MTFRQFAFNNVFRNKRLYAAYFLSSMFTVTVFFTFAIFAFHPELIDVHPSVTRGMSVAGWIIYVFSFFFILYSMSSFLQSRKKEFGLLLIHGMSNQQIRWMVFLENMLIGFFATILGIGIGLVFAKVILLIAENVLILDGSLDFYFPILPIIITFVSFILLFFFISLFVTIVLRTNKLITLVKSDKKGKSEPIASKWLTLLAIILLGIGYGIALTVEGPAVALALFPVTILVIIGTYLFFTQLSVYLIRKLKSKENIFWNKTNMLLLSDLSFRMKDNARAFFMVAIISTVAFSAIGTLVGLSSYLTVGLKSANPITFVYGVEDEQSVEAVEDIEQTLDQYDFTYEKAEIELTYYQQNDELKMIVTDKTYNAFAELIGEEKINVPTDQVTLVEQSVGNMMPSNKLEKKSITLENGKVIPVDLSGVGKQDILPEIFEYFIVGEQIYEQLGAPEKTFHMIGWEVIDGEKEDIVSVGQELSEKYDDEMFAVDYIVYDILKMWSPILFVGLFIGIVFFVSAGSFLYFRLYADLDDDKEKFLTVSKIGLSPKELRNIISKQTMLLFFAPIVVAVIHGAVALTALSNMFGYNLIFESGLVLGSFFVIQIVYFLVVRYFYTKQIKLAIY